MSCMSKEVLEFTSQFKFNLFFYFKLQMFTLQLLFYLLLGWVVPNLGTHGEEAMPPHNVNAADAAVCCFEINVQKHNNVG